MQDGFGAYLPKYRESKGKLTPAAALPYSVGGEPGGIVGARRSFGHTVLKKAKKERIELLLRVLGHLAAPFGSEEWELVHYGVEGTHFTRGQDSSPQATKLGEVENNTNLPLKYLAEGPQVLFVPGMPDAVRGPAHLAAENRAARHPQRLLRPPVRHEELPGHHPQGPPRRHGHRHRRRPPPPLRVGRHRKEVAAAWRRQNGRGVREGLRGQHVTYVERRRRNRSRGG
ncbi:hypothetical protein [Streptomyces adelaidensis]|uniref:hypothetical protein n=1 Tax=Streptomyces adelaidensis TaxID=2796465 RepID=UPI001F221BF7|nr:hypothetical protein [Streptomyces adelaidensis]